MLAHIEASRQILKRNKEEVEEEEEEIEDESVRACSYADAQL